MKTDTTLTRLRAANPVAEVASVDDDALFDRIVAAPVRDCSPAPAPEPADARARRGRVRRGGRGVDRLRPHALGVPGRRPRTRLAGRVQARADDPPAAAGVHVAGDRLPGRHRDGPRRRREHGRLDRPERVGVLLGRRDQARRHRCGDACARRARRSDAKPDQRRPRKVRPRTGDRRTRRSRGSSSPTTAGTSSSSGSMRRQRPASPPGSSRAVARTGPRPAGGGAFRAPPASTDRQRSCTWSARKPQSRWCS